MRCNFSRPFICAISVILFFLLQGVEIPVVGAVPPPVSGGGGGGGGGSVAPEPSPRLVDVEENLQDSFRDQNFTPNVSNKIYALYEERSIVLKPIVENPDNVEFEIKVENVDREGSAVVVPPGGEAEMTLWLGSNDLKLTLTYQSGEKDISKIYPIVVIREAPKLNNIVIQGESLVPDFSPNVKNYELRMIPFEKDKLIITPQSDDPAITAVDISSHDIYFGELYQKTEFSNINEATEIFIPVSNWVYVSVRVSEDGVHFAEAYNITVSRRGLPIAEITENLAADFNTDFNPEIYWYSIKAHPSESEATFTVASDDAEVTDFEIKDVNNGLFAQYPINTSFSIPLEGRWFLRDDIAIRLLKNETPISMYNIIIERSESTVPELANVEENLQADFYSENFIPGLTNDIQALYEERNVVLKPIVENPDNVEFEMKIENTEIADSAVIIQPGEEVQIPLWLGWNFLKITITDASGSGEHFIRVFRQAPKLSNILIQDESLSPDFSPEIPDYSLGREIPYEKDKLIITPISEDPAVTSVKVSTYNFYSGESYENAVSNINEAIEVSLPVGQFISFGINLSEDGVHFVRAYTITVSRLGLPVARITENLAEDFSPSFDPAIFFYDIGANSSEHEATFTVASDDAEVTDFEVRYLYSKDDSFVKYPINASFTVPLEGEGLLATLAIRLLKNETAVSVYVVAIERREPNNPPVAESVSFDMNQFETLTGYIRGSDPDGDEIQFLIKDQPSGGFLNFMNDGMFRYSPEFNFVGQDSFTFVASDGILQSEPATITINVHPLVDPVIYPVRLVGIEENLQGDFTPAFSAKPDSWNYLTALYEEKSIRLRPIIENPDNLPVQIKIVKNWDEESAINIVPGEEVEMPISFNDFSNFRINLTFGSRVLIYYLGINQEPPRLEGLVVEGETLNPLFTPSQHYYNLGRRLPFTQDKITITPQNSNPAFSVVRVMAGGFISEIKPFNEPIEVSLEAGVQENRIIIEMSEDGENFISAYFLYVQRVFLPISITENLAADFEPNVDPAPMAEDMDGYNYKLKAQRNETEVTFGVTSSDPLITSFQVFYKGEQVGTYAINNSFTLSSILEWPWNSEDVRIAVYAEAVYAGEYRILIYREEEKLASITENIQGDLSPNFDPSRSWYQLFALPNEDKITLGFQPENEFVRTVKVHNGLSGFLQSIPADQTVTFDLMPGMNIISITLYGEDENKPAGYYFIDINRQTAYLSSLTEDYEKADFTPAFAPTTHEYILKTRTDAKNVNINVGSDSENIAQILVDMGSVTIGEQNYFGELFAIRPGGQINVSLEGMERVTLNLTLQSLENNRLLDIGFYQIYVEKEASNVATLSALTGTANGSALPMIFNPEIANYAVVVANAASSAIITPVATDSYATIKVNGNSVESGASATLNLAVGLNNIAIEVIAEDGVTKKTYTVGIKREDVAVVVVVPPVPAGGGGGGQTVTPSIPLAPKVLGAKTALFPDNTIVRLKGTKLYFLIKDGKRIAMTYKTFKKKYGKKKVTIATKEQIKSIPIAKQKAAVKKTAAVKKIAKIFIKVLYPSVRIREGIGYDKKILDKAVKDQTFEVLEEKDGWYRIVFGEGSAWIEGKWVEKTS